MAEIKTKELLEKIIEDYGIMYNFFFISNNNDLYTFKVTNPNARPTAKVVQEYDLDIVNIKEVIQEIQQIYPYFNIGKIVITDNGEKFLVTCGNENERIKIK